MGRFRVRAGLPTVVLAVAIAASFGTGLTTAVNRGSRTEPKLRPDASSGKPQAQVSLPTTPTAPPPTTVALTPAPRPRRPGGPTQPAGTCPAALRPTRAMGLFCAGDHTSILAAHGSLWAQEGRDRHPDPTRHDCGSCYPSAEPGTWADTLLRVGSTGTIEARVTPRSFIGDFEMQGPMVADDTGLWLLGRIWHRRESTQRAHGCAPVSRTGSDGGGYTLLLHLNAGSLCPDRFIIASFDGAQANTDYSFWIRNIMRNLAYMNGRLWATESAWAGGFGSGPLIEINPQTGEKSRMNLEADQIVPGFGSLWLTTPTDPPDRSRFRTDVIRWDPNARSEVARVTVDGSPQGFELAIGDDEVFAAFDRPGSTEERDIRSIDSEDHELRSVYDDDASDRYGIASAMTFAAGRLYVAASKCCGSRVIVIDGSTYERHPDIQVVTEVLAELAHLDGTLWGARAYPFPPAAKRGLFWADIRR